ncbi:hypothetical protein FJ364_02400 [Candidatus Dependentiae bacterium]|nr:hypothetical protein [Candidatus Dependentiae bacterium]
MMKKIMVLALASFLCTEIAYPVWPTGVVEDADKRAHLAAKGISLLSPATLEKCGGPLLDQIEQIISAWEASVRLTAPVQQVMSRASSCFAEGVKSGTSACLSCASSCADRTRCTKCIKDNPGAFCCFLLGSGCCFLSTTNAVVAADRVAEVASCGAACCAIAPILCCCCLPKKEQSDEQKFIALMRKVLKDKQP